jgi:hypothetical protein
MVEQGVGNDSYGGGWDGGRRGSGGGLSEDMAGLSEIGCAMLGWAIGWRGRRSGLLPGGSGRCECSELLLANHTRL